MIPGVGDPRLGFGLEASTSMPVSVATAIFSRSRSDELADLLEVARQHGLERLDVGEFGLRLDHGRHAIEAVDQLRVDRMLDP